MDLHPYLFCLSFYLLYFLLPPFKENGLLFWVPDVLCQHSEVVLWNLLSIQMFFQWICGGESGVPILFLYHLRTTLDSILRSRDIPLSTKVCLVKAMAFPVVMYGHESWNIKKAECRRIDAFEMWCWRRLSRVPWAARRSNQSILKDISPEYPLEGLMLKLKFQYFDHPV